MGAAPRFHVSGCDSDFQERNLPCQFMHEMQIAFALKVSVRKCLRLVMFLGVVTGTRGKNYSPPYIKELFKGGDLEVKI